MLFFASFIGFLALIVMVMYYYRRNVAAYLPQRVRALFPGLQHYTPLSTFADQSAAGLTSSHFDIEADNMGAGDSRMGLDERGVQEVMDIMRREGVNFDQARLIRHNQILARNGIDPSGMPLDSKAVTRL